MTRQETVDAAVAAAEFDNISRRVMSSAEDVERQCSL